MIALKAFAFAAALAVLPLVAQAQSSASPYTMGMRYDATGRLTGTIAPDPDGEEPLKFGAIRYTYDTYGRLVRVEKGELAAWQSHTIAPSEWAGFTALSSVESEYDSKGRKTRENAKGEDDAIYSVTQYSYDAYNRLECTAQRMNPAAWSSLPASACALGIAGSYGQDRITRNTYDGLDRVTKVQEAYGTSIQTDEEVYTYLGSSQLISTITDARGYMASMTYDGFGRKERWYFPDKMSTGTANTSDFEEYSYDANGNRTSLRKRDELTLTYTYDALNRMVSKIVPPKGDIGSVHTRNVYYEYDLRGLQTAARFGLNGTFGVFSTYDGFGRPTSQRNNLAANFDLTLTYEYDANGNRLRIIHPDGVYFRTDYDGLNRAVAFRQNGTVMGSVTYNERGLPEERSWSYAAANNNKTVWSYDPAGRMASLAINLNGTMRDVTWTFPADDPAGQIAYNPAGQLVSEARNNDLYAWKGHVDVTRGYETNGLNQYTEVGPRTYNYDANGNLTSDGFHGFTYDVENRLVEYAGGGGAAHELRYDPLGRLYEINGSSGTTRFLYDGDALVAEYDASGTVLRRYVHGPSAGADDPLIWYEGSLVDASTRRFLHADRLGSIVSITSYNGTWWAINSYDEYGIPYDGQGGAGPANQGRFQYTGQAWLPELGMYYYKARIYSPTLGRFLQTDPIGYEDQWNLYAYVGNDPVNGVDPTGEKIVVQGTKVQRAILMAYLKGAGRSTKELNARYNSLVRSENVHVVKFAENRENSQNQTNGPHKNDENGIGTGSTTLINSAQPPLSDGTENTIGSMIAHELLGHAYDKDTGTIDRSIDPESGIRNSEIEASRIENQYRDANGLDRRTNYGEAPLPEEEKR